MKKSFRKLSVEKLSSPEQLDRLLTITRVSGWIALICLMILIAIIFMWTLFGKIPVTVEGNGIFFDPNAILVIQNDLDGVIEKIYIEEGDSVQKGDPLFELTNKSKSIELNELSNLITKMEEISEREGSDNQWELIKLQQQRESLRVLLQGLVIRAPIDGTILSIEVPLGKEVAQGSIIAWIEETELQSEENFIYGFFPLDMGEQIKPGMKALFQFEGISSELFGKMEGLVKETLPFASVQEHTLQSIPSQELRDFLTTKQATTQVKIQPIKDSTTISGYKWTTPKGPPFKISRGSVAKISIYIEEKKPINYLLK